MKPLRYTASALALGLALMANAQAVTTIPFWHSMEGELGKEVDSLAQRFNAENPDYKIVPTYKGNYEQNLSAGIAAFRTGNAPAILQVYEVGTATCQYRATSARLFGGRKITRFLYSLIPAGACGHIHSIIKKK